MLEPVWLLGTITSGLPQAQELLFCHNKNKNDFKKGLLSVSLSSKTSTFFMWSRIIKSLHGYCSTFHSKVF